MTPSSLFQSGILWRQVFGLATVQGSIALMWVIYNLYLPQLLKQFGFPQGFAIGLLILENGLAIVMEPLMGSLSDRIQHWVGSKFPFVALGVLLASSLFIGIPVVVIFGNAGIRWLLPVVLVAWALAMTMFRSPALSLLGQYAFATNLPQAASILTLVGALAGALGAFANQFILNLGPAIAFAVGSVVLLAAATVLRRVNPQRQISSDSLTPSFERNAWWKLALIFGAGVGIALGFTLVMRSLLSPATAQPDTRLLLAVFTVVHLVTVLPAGLLAIRLGNTLAMLLGLGVAVGSLLLLAIAYGTFLAPVLIAIFAIAWSFVANGTIPLALSLVPPHRSGLGTGMFFGGGALAVATFGAMSVHWGPLPSAIAALLAAFSLLVAGLFVGISWQIQKS